MIVLRLDLIAFGPFSRRTLDFSAAPRALHVVYGPNEAGKSTALRALSGVLFGIPRSTQDAHAFRPQDLRIGALLAAGDGEPVYVVRRKGDKNTLLDADGRPADGARLAKLLGGVDEESFATMFGIDHESLRRGGEALVEARGEIGETLLGAALGSTAIQSLLARLREEADALWAPQAHKRPLNEALKTYVEAHRRAQLEPTTVEAWAAQKRGIEECAERAHELTAELAEVRSTLASRRQLLSALPLLERRRALARRREALAGTVRLPLTAARDREQALADLADARRQLEDLALEIRNLEAKRAELSVAPEGEKAAALEAVEAVAARLATHDEWLDEIARLEDVAGRLEVETRAALARLEGVVAAEALADPSRLDRLRLGTSAQARLRKTASERPALEAEARRLEAALAARRCEASRARESAAAIEQPPDAGDLSRAVARIRRLGDVERAAAVARDASVRQLEACRAEAVALGLSALELEEVERLAAPLPETIDRFARELEAIDRTRARAAEAERAAEQRLAKVQHEIEALERAGSVPTENDLDAARSRRDEAWRELRAVIASAKKPRRSAGDEGDAHATRGGEHPTLEAIVTFEQRVREADEIADRLRREAERAGRMARLLADRSAATAEREAAASEGREAEERREALATKWERMLEASRVPSATPAEVRAWISRHAALVRSIRDARAARDEAKRLDEIVATAERELIQTLQAVGGAPRPVAPPPAKASLDVLLDRAEARLRELESSARAKADATREAERAEADVAALEREASAARQALDAWGARWSELLAPLPVAREATPEEVLGLLAELSDLFPKLGELARVRQRLATLRAEVSAFEGSVRELVESRAPDLARLPTAAAADEIVRRCRQAERDRLEAAHLDRAIVDAHRRASDQAAREKRAEARLAELMRAAGVSDLAALEEAERRSADLVELERELKDVEVELLRAGGGVDPERLEQDAAEWDPDTLAEEIARLEDRVEELDTKRQGAEREVGAKEAGLRELETRSVAADAAADAEQALAKVRRLASRWAELKLAAAVIEREIERFRKANQGPIVSRASELFARFTLGSFAGLSVSYDERDETVLVGVRPDGKEVPVAGMSDGTRDPLYLALRVASLEHDAAAGETMPLVVDDVLVHLDDDRARAVLASLGELAERTQVLFFTHHTRLVELARAVVPAARLVEHRL